VPPLNRATRSSKATPGKRRMIGQKDTKMRNVRFLLFAAVVLTLVVLTIPPNSVAQLGIAITIGPPALPVYEQPPCPAEGYLWTPGYWAYDSDDADYYWVPGTWVLAPQVGFLWTPGWWGWGGGAFLFHEGYWGPHVGFYGGVAYGFGYFGNGYEGGRWDGDHFFYNRTVNNVSVTNIHNTYNTTVINNTTVSHVSYNGGEGGITARPSPEEERYANERHVPPVAAQTEHVQAARSDRQLHASVNQGRPPIAATPKPGALNDRAAVPAKEAGAPYHPPANRGGAEQHGNQQAAHPQNDVPRPAAPNDAKDLQSHPRPAAPNTGNAKQDQKYQQQQEKLAAEQEKEHQKLAAQQEKEHQQMTKQNANEAARQQMEQRHQQQTQQMEQKHSQQQQQLQTKQQPRSNPQERPAEPKK
jgi:hypothetical protein